ncbi:MAG: recombinase family protein [Oscillospiraceae bacterium]|nr:recombinase family protein [Oscillospiraceae bacterium]MBR2366222.1 recombinase family protein [Oscillospiraceae bacterium]MBR2977240.1 recombinase family protein [Oscillospiraceae bacterium]
MAEQYLVYLRKSRQDREQELQTGKFDTLQRHRSALLTLAKDRGYSIAEILEEVVSGDTIAARPQMQQLLSLVETGQYAGVLCMEVARLARGKTRDQGVVSETFRYSGTKIITPDKVYDPANEMDEDFFEFSLFMSRQEYKMINKRLNRGRISSLEEGKYIAGAAPFGYEKYKLKGQKGFSLRPNPETAPIVQRIYSMYVDGEPGPSGALEPLGSYRIAKKLNAESIPSPGGTLWTAGAVRDILKNPTYKGSLRWRWRPVCKRMENGIMKISTPTNTEALIRDGIHEPLVSSEVWDRAQTLRTGNVHSCVPEKRTPQNPLIGLIYCARCGHAMTRQLASGHNRYDRYACLSPECITISHRADETERAVLVAMRAWLSQYRLDGKRTPDGREKAARVAQEAVDKKKKALLILEGQQQSLYDLLEQGVYTTEVFLQRSQNLAQRKAVLQQELREAEEIEEMASQSVVMWKNIIPTMRAVLDSYSYNASPTDRNKLLKQVLVKITYQKDNPGEQPTLTLFPKVK